LLNVIEQAKPFAGDKTKKAIEKAEEILADELFIAQKGVRSLVDEDARVGSKSKTSRFFGYKNEFIMTTEERIITAVKINSGEYVDGTDYKDLLDRTMETGIHINEMFGDKAYFKKEILDSNKFNSITSYIPVSLSAFKMSDEWFSYNKDSDCWICKMGNITIKKILKKRTRRWGKSKSKEAVSYVFTFEKEKCINCTHRAECIGKGKAKARKLQVSINASEYYEILQNQKSDEFLEKYKKRAAHEWKNGEMKRFHGLYRARGYGLQAMSTQAKLTAIAVNLKRIAGLMTAKTLCFFENICSKPNWLLFIGVMSKKQKLIGFAP
jgi:hypothetical protein